MRSVKSSVRNYGLPERKLSNPEIVNVKAEKT